MQQIADIKNKLQQLIKQHQQLQKENVQLKDTVARHLQTIEEQKQTVQQLQSRVDIAQINQSVLSKKDKVALEKRINNYLKEIDLCLSLLHKD